MNEEGDNFQEGEMMNMFKGLLGNIMDPSK